jgi:hypothetical protein
MTIPSNNNNSNTRRYRSIPYLVFRLAVAVVVAVVVWTPWLPPVRAWTTKQPNNNNNNPLLLPPPLPIKSIPLPVKLAGGLFLFGASAFQNENDRVLREEILKLAEDFLRADPLVSMELGLGIEAGGVFASLSSVHWALVETESSSSSSIDSSGDEDSRAPGTTAASSAAAPAPTPKRTTTSTKQVTQMSMEFQLNGGNSWAQARVSGIRYGTQNDDSPVQLISLGVANMDASLNGGWAEVTLPQLQAPTILKYI